MCACCASYPPPQPPDPINASIPIRNGRNFVFFLCELDTSPGISLELKYDKQHIHESLPRVQPWESRCSSGTSGWYSNWLESLWVWLLPGILLASLRVGRIADSDAEALTLPGGDLMMKRGIQLMRGKTSPRRIQWYVRGLGR